LPELQIYDLRNPDGPVMTFEKGHVDGIHCVDWCSKDPTLLVTGGRDSKVVVWNYETTEKVTELNFSSSPDNQIKSVEWGKLPGILSVTFKNSI